MISYEIRKKRPDPPPQVGVYRNVADIVRERRERQPQQQAAWIPAAQREQQQQPATGGRWPGTAIQMGKIGYSRWLDEMVHKFFKRGDYLTLKSVPYKIGELPSFVLQLVEINELYYDVEMDLTSREPRALYVRSMSGFVTAWYPPCKLRILNSEEVKLLDILRDQKASTISAADNPAAGAESGGTTEVSSTASGERDADEPPNEGFSG